MTLRWLAWYASVCFSVMADPPDAWQQVEVNLPDQFLLFISPWNVASRQSLMGGGRLSLDVLYLSHGGSVMRVFHLQDQEQGYHREDREEKGGHNANV